MRKIVFSILTGPITIWTQRSQKYKYNFKGSLVWFRKKRLIFACGTKCCFHMHFQWFLIVFFWIDKTSFHRTSGGFRTRKARGKISRLFMKIKYFTTYICLVQFEKSRELLPRRQLVPYFCYEGLFEAINHCFHTKLWQIVIQSLFDIFEWNILFNPQFLVKKINFQAKKRVFLFWVDQSQSWHIDVRNALQVKF